MMNVDVHVTALSSVENSAVTFVTVAQLDLVLFAVSDLKGGLVLVLSVVGLLFSQALALLSVFFACEVMPTIVR